MNNSVTETIERTRVHETRGENVTAADDQGGFHHGWAREAQCEARLAGLADDLRCDAPLEEGRGWAQALGGSAGHIRALAEAFDTLRRNGRISRFPDRGITVARQTTCSPYGLPAVLLRLKGTCRMFSERLGMRLLETTPRIITLTEVAPAVVLVENTPPLDHIWDEQSFWTAWQAIAPAAWDVVDAWAAIRVLRFVETRERTWKFYDHSGLAQHRVACVDDLPIPPKAAPVVRSGQQEQWRRRRCRDIALALQIDGGAEAGLRGHILGSLATPHPLLQPHGDDAIPALEDWLAKAASALHAGFACGGDDADKEALVLKAQDGLRVVHRVLRASRPAEDIAKLVFAPESGQSQPAVFSQCGL